MREGGAPFAAPRPPDPATRRERYRVGFAGGVAPLNTSLLI